MKETIVYELLKTNKEGRVLICAVIEISIDDIKRCLILWDSFFQMVLKVLEEKWYKALELQSLKAEQDKFKNLIVRSYLVLEKLSKIHVLKDTLL